MVESRQKNCFFIQTEVFRHFCFVLIAMLFPSHTCGCGKVEEAKAKNELMHTTFYFFHQNWMMLVHHKQHHIQMPYKINVRLYAYEVRKFNMEKKPRWCVQYKIYTCNWNTFQFNEDGDDDDDVADVAVAADEMTTKNTYTYRNWILKSKEHNCPEIFLHKRNQTGEHNESKRRRKNKY